MKKLFLITVFLVPALLTLANDPVHSPEQQAVISVVILPEHNLSAPDFQRASFHLDKAGNSKILAIVVPVTMAGVGLLVHQDNKDAGLALFGGAAVSYVLFNSMAGSHMKKAGAALED